MHFSLLKSHIFFDGLIRSIIVGQVTLYFPGFKKVGEKELNKGIVSIPMERNI